MTAKRSKRAPVDPKERAIKQVKSTLAKMLFFQGFSMRRARALAARCEALARAGNDAGSERLLDDATRRLKLTPQGMQRRAAFDAALSGEQS